MVESMNRKLTEAEWAEIARAHNLDTFAYPPKRPVQKEAPLCPEENLKTGKPKNAKDLAPLPNESRRIA